jgi:hypothetical protein
VREIATDDQIRSEVCVHINKFTDLYEPLWDSILPDDSAAGTVTFDGYVSLCSKAGARWGLGELRAASNQLQRRTSKQHFEKEKPQNPEFLKTAMGKN